MYLHAITKVTKFIRQNRMAVVRGLDGEEQNGPLLFNEYLVSVLEDDKVLQMDGR